MIFPILAVFAVLGIIVGVTGVVSWQQYPNPGARPFALVAAGTVWWIGAMVLAHVSDLVFGLHAVFVFLTRVEWVGIFVLTASWVLFVFAYTGRSEFVTRRVAGLLLAFPLFVYPVAFANGVILDAVGSTLGSSPGLTAAFDPWLTLEPLVLAYIYALLIASTVLLLSFLFTSRLPHPEVAILWLLALVIPWTVNALYMTGVIPPLGPAMLDPTPFGFVGLAGVGFVAMRQSESFRMAPLARAYVVDNLAVGIVVFDSADRIVDANEYARSILCLDPGDIGRDLRGVLTEAVGEPVVDPRGPETPLGDSIDGEIVSIETDAGSREIAMEIASLENQGRGQIESYGLVLRDETERIERQQTLEGQNEQLEVLNQVIRHDIRNDMQVVRGMADLLGEYVDPDGEPYVHTIEERAEYVVELTRTVRNLTDTILGDEDDLAPVSLLAVLDREISEMAASHDGATIEGPAAEEILVLANDMLGSVFRNLLQNAVLHNDSDAPRVRVSVVQRESTVRVSIQDNGPGIPPEQREAIFERGERGQGSDGSGLGLYLVATLVDQYEGDVWVEPATVDTTSWETGPTRPSNDHVPSGSRFVVELQRAGIRDVESRRESVASDH